MGWTPKVVVVTVRLQQASLKSSLLPPCNVFLGHLFEGRASVSSLPMLPPFFNLFLVPPFKERTSVFANAAASVLRSSTGRPMTRTNGPPHTLSVSGDRPLSS